MSAGIYKDLLKKSIQDLLDDDKILNLIEEQRWGQLNIACLEKLKDKPNHKDLYTGIVNLCWNTDIPADKAFPVKDLPSYYFGDWGHQAFDTVKVPGYIEKISEYAFADTTFEEITIGDGVKEIYYGAFSGCHNLTTVTFPESLEFIDDYAFEDCSKLKTITLPKSLQEVGKDLFAKCNYLRKIIFNGTMKQASNLGLANYVTLGLTYDIDIICTDGYLSKFKVH